MSASASPFTIVVGLDFKEAGGFAFGQAARMTQALPGSHIDLVHVFHDPLTAERKRELGAQLRTYANEKSAFVGGLKGVTIGVHLRTGDIVREIVQLATDVGANLVVVGSHKGPNMKSWVLGSVAEKILVAAPCPVLVAGPKPPPVTHQPVIEPACPDCLRARAATHDKTWWCERHSQHAAHAHVFSYRREIPLDMHDSEVIPTGIDF